MDVLSASIMMTKSPGMKTTVAEFQPAMSLRPLPITPHSVYAADVDGDGDLDVLSASAGDDKIAWYENDGQQTFTTHIITTAANGAESVHAADVDGDGDLDVLSASYWDDKIAWYENDGQQNFTSHTITNAADGATSVYAADVDGDGDLDVFSASYL
jgi:PKD repeat protein